MKVAMIGIKAIPAHFGGFETAVDETSRGLVRQGHEVTVYNRRGMAPITGDEYEGVRLVTLPTVKSKNLSTIVHAFLSTLHVSFSRTEIVHYFTTGATLFAPIPRLLGKKTICSVDGCDWQRAKWGRFARWYLRTSERIACWCCNGLISDSREVEQYYAQHYGAESACITYGVREYRSERDDVLQKFGLRPRDYILFVGRLVPENNVHHLVEAFEQSKADKRLVIVGDDPWERAYVSRLKSTADPRIVFTGGVYGDGYSQLQQSAYCFVLPDEVGGTHPALVEAMGYGNCVLVNDTSSNLEAIGDAGLSYRGSDGSADLLKQLQKLLDHPEVVEAYRKKAKAEADRRYCWKRVVLQHIALYEKVLGRARARKLEQPAIDCPQTEESA